MMMLTNVFKPIRNFFTDPLPIEKAQELTDCDIHRLKYNQSIALYKSLDSELKEHHEYSQSSESEIKTQLNQIKKSVDGGDELLLSNLSHVQKRLDRLADFNLETNQKLSAQLKKSIEDIDNSYIDLLKGLSTFGDFLYKRYMAYSLGVDRKKMPQIDDNDAVFSRGEYKEEKVKLSELKPTQSDINEDKVIGMLYGGFRIPTEWIISADNFIMDGHHRWASTLEIFHPDTEVTVYRSNKNAKELLDDLTKGCKEEKFRKVIKAFNDGELIKGYYVNNPENRKKGRVGQKYGGEKGVEIIGYHGTSKKNASLIKKEGFKELPKMQGVLGIHFGTLEKYAKPYAKDGEIIKLKLKFKNPIYSDDYFKLYDKIEKEGFKRPTALGGKEFVEEMKKRLLRAGHDAVITPSEIVVLNADDIKLADNKTFDPNSNDITKGIVTDKKEAIATAINEAGLEDADNDYLVTLLRKSDEDDNDWNANEYAAGICLDHEGKILFLKRRHDDKFHPSTWNLPAGGIEMGEMPKDAMKREFKEETNIEVRNCWKAGVKLEKNAKIYYYWVEIDDLDKPLLALLDSEHEQYAWMAEDEWRKENLILDLKAHLMEFTAPIDEKPIKIEKAHSKNNPNLVAKKVLVKQAGKKPYWQTKYVKIFEEPKTPLKKQLKIEAFAEKLKIDSDVLKDIYEDIESIIWQGDEYKIEKTLGSKGDIYLINKIGVSDKKVKTGYDVILKEGSKIPEVEKKKDGEYNKQDALNIMKLAKANESILTLQGKQYTLLNYNDLTAAVKIEGNHDTIQTDEIIEKIIKELKAKNAEFKKQKNWNKVGSLKDSDFEVIKNLGGSTGAVLVKDKKTGTKYVRKGGASLKHMESELLALNVYKAFGVDVPVETKKTKKYLYNRYVEGIPLGAWLKDKTEEQKKEMYNKVGKHYVVDALLGNWDVVGLDYDNIIVDPSDVPIRVDVGGSLGYRAMGKPKDDKLWKDADNVIELDSLRDVKVNPQSADIFNNADISIVEQVDNLPAFVPSWITPKSQRDIIQKRLDSLKDEFEGLPTKLEPMGDLYPVTKGMSSEAKAFNKRLSKAMEFTPKDMKMLVKLEEEGDSTVQYLMNEEIAKKYFESQLTSDLRKEFEKIGINYRELYAIQVHTSSSGASGHNQALRKLVGEEHNVVEKGAVFKYKSEFEDVSKEAYSLSNIVYSEVDNLQKVINKAQEASHSDITGTYGITPIQTLNDLKKGMDETLKDENAADIITDMTKHFYPHVEKLLDAFNKKTGYEVEIEPYIPSNELKEKYGDIVDMSFATNPVNWDDEIYKEVKKVKSKSAVQSSLFDGNSGKKLKKIDSSGLTKWGNSHIVKHLINAKLATRGLVKAERFKGGSKVIWKDTVGRKISPNDTNLYIDQHQEGNVVYWSNVNSCSTNFGWSGNVVNSIKPIGGLRTEFFSHFKNEKEVTLKPFPRMRVVSYKEGGGKHNYTIKQIG